MDSITRNNLKAWSTTLSRRTCVGCCTTTFVIFFLMLSANLVGPMGFIVRLGSVGIYFSSCSALHCTLRYEKISWSSIFIDHRRGHWFGTLYESLSACCPIACTACCLCLSAVVIIWDIRCRDCGPRPLNRYAYCSYTFFSCDCITTHHIISS